MHLRSPLHEREIRGGDHDRTARSNDVCVARDILHRHDSERVQRFQPCAFDRSDELDQPRSLPIVHIGSIRLFSGQAAAVAYIHRLAVQEDLVELVVGRDWHRLLVAAVHELTEIGIADLNQRDVVVKLQDVSVQTGEQ